VAAAGANGNLSIMNLQGRMQASQQAGIANRHKSEIVRLKNGNLFVAKSFFGDLDFSSFIIKVK
jgi:hypothetical protein